MTDKELLELAAKAAGIKIDKSETNGGGRGNTGFNVLGDAVIDWHNYKTWNPLTNDGDALRLAVKLSMGIVCLRAIGHDKTTAVQCQTLIGNLFNIRVDEGCDGDPYKATRRAIVRAAAEIGKGMK